MWCTCTAPCTGVPGLNTAHDDLPKGIGWLKHVANIGWRSTKTEILVEGLTKERERACFIHFGRRQAVTFFPRGFTARFHYMWSIVSNFSMETVDDTGYLKLTEQDSSEDFHCWHDSNRDAAIILRRHPMEPTKCSHNPVQLISSYLILNPVVRQLWLGFLVGVCAARKPVATAQLRQQLSRTRANTWGDRYTLYADASLIGAIPNIRSRACKPIWPSSMYFAI